jgi:hypothetical protein
MPSLYWLCYRVGGTFRGLVLLEATSRADACLRAELENLNPGGECESYEIGAEEARAIPSEFVGVLLGKDQVGELEKILVAHTPKKPPASSVTDDLAGRESA